MFVLRNSETPMPSESKDLLEQSIVSSLQQVSGAPSIPYIAKALVGLSDDLELFNKAVDLHLKELDLPTFEKGMTSTSIKSLARFRHEAR